MQECWPQHKCIEQQVKDQTVRSQPLSRKKLQTCCMRGHCGDGLCGHVLQWSAAEAAGLMTMWAAQACGPRHGRVAHDYSVHLEQGKVG